MKSKLRKKNKSNHVISTHYFCFFQFTLQVFFTFKFRKCDITHLIQKCRKITINILNDGFDFTANSSIYLNQYLNFAMYKKLVD